MNRTIRIPDNIALVACSYCSETFRTSANRGKTADSGESSSSQLTSHGICPKCLLKNFPQEYLMIQKDGRLRIKRFFDQKYTKIEPR